MPPRIGALVPPQTFTSARGGAGFRLLAGFADGSPDFGLVGRFPAIDAHSAGSGDDPIAPLFRRAALRSDLLGGGAADDLRPACFRCQFLNIALYFRRECFFL